MSVGVSLWFMVWVRYVVHMILVSCLVIPIKGWRIWRTQRLGAQLLRGTTMLLATLSLFTALHFLPQAEATAINFLAPLLMLAMAPWALGEPMRLSRWVAAIVGFIGVLIVIRPSSGLNPIGVTFGLITALLFSVQFLTTRRVALDDPMTTLLWSGAFGTVFLTLALPFILVTELATLRQLTAMQWLILLGMGFWGGLGHLLQIQAYRFAPASVLAPFLYLQIVSAAGLGWLVWGAFPDSLTWLGILIICTSGVAIAWLEWRQRPSG